MIWRLRKMGRLREIGQWVEDRKAKRGRKVGGG